MSMTGPGSGPGGTNPVSMQTASTSQSVDSVGSSNDGGASALQALMGLGSTIGTQVIAGQQQGAAYNQQLKLAQLRASTVSSPSVLLIVGVVAAIFLFSVMGKE